MNFEEWQEKYHTKEFIDIRKLLSPKEIDILKRFGIQIENKIYTEYDYDTLRMRIGEYYIDKDMDEEDLEMSRSLKDADVDEEEYMQLLEKFDSIDKLYEEKRSKIKV